MMRVLLTGSGGQVGRVLAAELKKMYGEHAVLATDLLPAAEIDATLDCTDSDAVQQIVAKFKPQHVYHLAAILSARGERNPAATWDTNSLCWLNVLEASRQQAVERIFFPSSIAVYGAGIGEGRVNDHSPTRPLTMYGITKASGENLAAYYATRYNMDIRTLRYPGLIGWESEPGGGTTDYAVEIFLAAARGEVFNCPLAPHRRLPMLAMPDAIAGTLAFMNADRVCINQHHGYNISGFSVTPEELHTLICEVIPDFQMNYTVDMRDEIAQNWPQYVDDQDARRDWGWQPNYDLARLAYAMLAYKQEEVAAEQAQSHFIWKQSVA